MDYCATCRRHLNGALSCPGCGGAGTVQADPAWHSQAGPAVAPMAHQPGPQPAVPTAQLTRQQALAPTAQLLATEPKAPAVAEIADPEPKEPRSAPREAREVARVPAQRRRGAESPRNRRRQQKKRRRGIVAVSVAGLLIGGITAVTLATGDSGGGSTPAGSVDPGEPETSASISTPPADAGSAPQAGSTEAQTGKPHPGSSASHGPVGGASSPGAPVSVTVNPTTAPGGGPGSSTPPKPSTTGPKPTSSPTSMPSSSKPSCVFLCFN